MILFGTNMSLAIKLKSKIWEWGAHRGLWKALTYSWALRIPHTNTKLFACSEEKPKKAPISQLWHWGSAQEGKVINYHNVKGISNINTESIRNGGRHWFKAFKEISIQSLADHTIKCQPQQLHRSKNKGFREFRKATKQISHIKRNNNNNQQQQQNLLYHVI